MTQPDCLKGALAGVYPWDAARALLEGASGGLPPCRTSVDLRDRRNPLAEDGPQSNGKQLGTSWLSVACGHLEPRAGRAWVVRDGGTGVQAGTDWTSTGPSEGSLETSEAAHVEVADGRTALAVHVQMPP